MQADKTNALTTLNLELICLIWFSFPSFVSRFIVFLLSVNYRQIAIIKDIIAFHFMKPSAQFD